MGIVNLYECFDNGESIGIKTAKEWKQELGIGIETVRVYAAEGYHWKYRYCFRCVARKKNEAAEELKEWAKKWDQTVAQIRRACWDVKTWAEEWNQTTAQIRRACRKVE